MPVGADKETPVVLDEDGRLCQPCACFDGTRMIYADRPSPCRTFDCRVLQIVKKGLSVREAETLALARLQLPDRSSYADFQVR